LQYSIIDRSFSFSLKVFTDKTATQRGDVKNMTNYRPVLLLISFSKILSEVTYVRLLEYINNNNILVDEQFGFRLKNVNIIGCL
jgi:hypothetical protein